ncbi:MAG: phosphate acetyltransferase [Ruminobacter sp.]|uniref:phosphate acetyltransferase n=1 Tax=Ruminobacter sp. TaxID=2774296 RepID=UPI001B5E8542|nr:phosphate acetyltransferase [Ruminobacter sp.]MBP3749235.1 phosphate acetyltransferase [Ruminobacter sp.]
MLIPIGTGVGVTSISLGLVRAFAREGVKVSFFKPVAQPKPTYIGPEASTAVIKAGTDLDLPEPIEVSRMETLLSSGDDSTLLEEIIANFENHAAASGADVIIVEGLVPVEKHPFANRLNKQIASGIDADIVFVTQPGNGGAQEIRERLELAVNTYVEGARNRVLGCVINKVGASVDSHGVPTQLEVGKPSGDLSNMNLDDIAKVLASIPWNPSLNAARASDLASYLQCQVLNEGELATRRLSEVVFCARDVQNMVDYIKPGSLLVTSGDRSDIIISIALAAMNGTKIGALLLTGGYNLDERVKKLCEQAFATGLPILQTEDHTWQTAIDLQHFNTEIPADDAERINLIADYVAGFIDKNWLETQSEQNAHVRLLSPAAFRYKLTERARAERKRIVLPEGNEPRTVKAAAICAARGIATPVLLGNPEEIQRVAAQQGVVLGEGVEIIDPVASRENYVERLVELRKSKGLTPEAAREQLEDNVVLGTMMIERNEVDGLVSGAVHTTANTIRPPLQIIKTAPGSSLVSSVFFMLLPDQVLVYGDCAINPDPTAEQLAEIAIQSSDTAKAFGIEPRVAMLSYSTGTSGKGEDVEKVRTATEIAKTKRPDLVIDGPLQYDAAIMADVAASKAPNSPVAGKATVFIFPDLNTGNIAYKAVQRSAKLVSIGPMLQGMKKPVNDLSRGALVDDIVYTIAITAIQAQQNK